MPREFSKLTEAEKQQMFDAIPMITILVAGADGNMDDQELEWAEKLTKIRSFDFSNRLNEYYATVGEQFSTRLNDLVVKLPKDTAERMNIVTEKLAALNPILTKMDHHDAVNYYQNFRSFARHVAEASGGILGFASVSKEEAEVIELPMLEVFE